MKAVRMVAVLTVAGLVTSGCGVFTGGLRGVDLPGGADLGSNPYTVTIQFADVSDLVPQSLVKVDDVSVGSVESIAVDPRTWNAIVKVAINGDVKLPRNATARVRTTSLLGEKFVDVGAPTSGAAGQLADGDTISLADSGKAVDVEEVLGALSLLLNGGGVAQLKTISTELNNALKGNEPQIRSLLDNLDTLVSGLDSKKSEITRAIDGLNRLTATLDDRRGQITNTLDNLAPGLKELESQRAQLVDMLQSLDRLSGVATNVVNRSRDDTLADLRALQPTLQKLADSGQDFPDSLQILGSFPFTDFSQNAIPGDYANLYLDVDLDLKDLLDNLARSNQPFPGPDTPLLNLLPPTAQLLAPIIGDATPPKQPAFPILGPVPTPLGGLDPNNPPPTRAPKTTPAPTPPPANSPLDSLGRFFGGLLGGGG